MKKREQGLVPTALDAEIVKATLARRKPCGVEAGARSAAARSKKRTPACTEQRRVPLLVECVPQIQAPKQRIRCDLRSTREISAAVGLGRGEREEFAPSPRLIQPDPSVQR